MSSNLGSIRGKQTRFGIAFRGALIALASVAILLAGFVFLRQVLNTEVLGSTWDSRYQGCVEDVDHSRLDRLLRKYVDDQGLVRYRAWQANEADRAELRDYLELLSSTGIDGNGKLFRRRGTNGNSNDHEIAFWVNAHNALVIQGILDVYPTDSIRQHANPVGYDIRQHLKLMTGGRAYSLNDIERTCLAGFQDPRVRFAISNASRSCPPLLNRAWTADDAPMLLDQCASEYLNSSAHCALDKNNELRLAKMLDENNSNEYWTTMGSWRSLAHLIEDERMRQQIELNTAKVVFTPHDWSLNEKR